MITFTLMINHPTGDEEEGHLNVKVQGADGHELMPPHEWGHIQARALQVLEEYYLKCWKGNEKNTAPVGDVLRSIAGGMLCELKEQTTYTKRTH